MAYMTVFSPWGSSKSTLAANGGEIEDAFMPATLPAELFLQQFLVAHGELMSGDDLRRALGFHSERSFLRAVRAQELPVVTFCLPKRRGRYARTRDVAMWLSSLGRAEQPGRDADSSKIQEVPMTS